MVAGRRPKEAGTRNLETALSTLTGSYQALVFRAIRIYEPRFI
jgi:hypothetical protein